MHQFCPCPISELILRLQLVENPNIPEIKQKEPKIYYFVKHHPVSLMISWSLCYPFKPMHRPSDLQEIPLKLI